MNIINGHVAILVESIQNTLDRVSKYNYPIGEIEEFESEGTKEVYLGDDNKLGQLLLIEAIGDGPYKKAFMKRGEGLHHICLLVDDVENYVYNLSGSGWLLNPISVKTMKESDTAWLSRACVPTLIEVYQPDENLDSTAANSFISSIELPESSEKVGLLKKLGADYIIPSVDSKIWLTIEGNRIQLNDLLN
ncbi:MAG: hypothetical protein COA79_01440 [Planctomycetota bacterium]|nr:MAG: hypothetical protein COA79_01440 [Planctomycetota bacterium]